MRSLLLLLVVVALRAGDTDLLITDRWFVGDIDHRPSMTMHAVVLRKADGTFSDRVETSFLIRRTLAGAANAGPGTPGLPNAVLEASAGMNITLDIRDTQTFVVDAEGEIRAFTFDRVENGVTTSAIGTVADGKATVTVLRLGRAIDSVIEIPAGTRLLGQQASQERLAKASWRRGDQQKFATLALLGAQVRVVTVTATFQKADDVGNLTFDQRVDLMPVPTTLTLDPNGDLLGMTVDMGFLKMSFAPSDGPVPLVGAELAPAGLVTAKGPAPASGPANRYRLPADAAVPADEFQSQRDGVVTTRAEAEASVLVDPAPYLKAEPQLEIDDPQLKAWVDTLVARHQMAKPVLAERLRLAVRGYIVKKDLSMGDASALEAFRTRTGDCSEHANLLAAVLRIADIPSRVELGMVYAQDFGGWVGHAWNSAYVGDRWVHLDSAYPGIPRSCYLKLGTTSGPDDRQTAAAMAKAFATVLGKEVERLTP